MSDDQSGMGQGGYQPPSGGTADGGYYVPPPTGAPGGGGAAYPGGQGWQDLSGGGGLQGGPMPPPPPPTRRFGSTALRVVVVVAIIFGGSIWAFFTSADRGEDGAISKGGDLDVVALQVGDCFDNPGDVEEVASIRAVPCGEAHDNEVILVFDLPEAGSLPSREVIDEHIGMRCLPAFDEFVGIAYEESELDLFTFEPTADGWRQGDHSVTCAVYDLSGEKLVGTARGVAR